MKSAVVLAVIWYICVLSTAGPFRPENLRTRMKILAIDDEPYILELIPMLARVVGFPDVTTADSGMQALEIIEASDVPFDCLILDINMPGMDGIELCRCIRQIETYRRTPIIMLTAMSERDFVDEAFRAGATDYVTKPFDIKELAARLRVAQELVAARAEAAAARILAAAPMPAGRRDLAEPLVIPGAANISDLTALSNYLRQLSRAGLSVCQVMAVMVNRIGEIHARASEAEFLFALSEVATAIETALLTHIGLMAYAGNGVFVIVSTAASPLDPVEVESDVQEVLDTRDAEFDDGSPMDLEVSVGSPVLPTNGGNADFDRAIARAATRSSSGAKRAPVRRFRQPLN